MDREIYERMYMALGLLGAAIVLYGYSQSDSDIYYIIGSLTLLITALHFQLVFFIALECILLACHFSMMLGIGFYSQIALPILLCIQLFIFYYMLGRKYNMPLIIGIIGIALISLGFSYNKPWLFFFGSICVAIYAFFMGFRRVYPAFVWAGLNTIYADSILFAFLFKT